MTQSEELNVQPLREKRTREKRTHVGASNQRALTRYRLRYSAEPMLPQCITFVIFALL
jgi:hypothetical protein